MREVLILAIHLLVTLAKLLRPGGVRGDITLYVYSGEDESNPTFNEVAADVKSSFTDLAGLKLSPLEDIELGDGTVAPRALITGTNSYQVEVGFEFLFTQYGPMDYFLIFVGPREALEADQATLDRIFKSFVPSAASLYGIDRSQALILLGGADPIDKDLDPDRWICSTEYLPMFSGLVRLTPQLQLEPDLAENWTVSPDGLVYTFTLREGLTFASGRPLTALDVKFSWERACDPETESSTARTYLGDILGANEKLDGKADEISGVKVIDDMGSSCHATWILIAAKIRPSRLSV